MLFNRSSTLRINYEEQAPITGRLFLFGHNSQLYFYCLLLGGKITSTGELIIHQTKEVNDPRRGNSNDH